MSVNSEVYHSVFDFFLDYPFFIVLTVIVAVMAAAFVMVTITEARVRREDIRVNARVTAISSSNSGGAQSLYVQLSAVYNEEHIITNLTGVTLAQIGSVRDGDMLEVLIDRKHPTRSLLVGSKQSKGTKGVLVFLIGITLAMTAVCVLLYMGVNVFLLI